MMTPEERAQFIAYVTAAIKAAEPAKDVEAIKAALPVSV